MRQNQKLIFEALLNETEKNANIMGEIASDLMKFHHRCLPRRTHGDFDVGISAVKHRNEREGQSHI